MTPPRIAPGGVRDTGPLIWIFARAAGFVTGTNPPHVFSTLGRGRGLFWGWLHFAGRLMPGGVLPRRETELVILRVAHVRQSAYEFEHHRQLGRRAGLTDSDIANVMVGPGAEPWSPRDRALLQAADELLDRRDITDPTWTSLRQHLNERAALELVLLVGHYDMLATTLRTLRVEPDRPGRVRRLLRRRR